MVQQDSGIGDYLTLIIDVLANSGKVVSIGNNLLIHHRPFSEELLPWDNGNETFSLMTYSRVARIIMIVSCTIGAIIGWLII